MNFSRIQHIRQAWLGSLAVTLVIAMLPAPGYTAAADSSVSPDKQAVVERPKPVAASNSRQVVTTAPKKPVVSPKKNEAAAEANGDYFVSSDTVIIGCTAGMAAGILVGSVPVAGAVMSGIGVPESVSLLINLTGMGCGVGAVSSAVAIFTAWMLAPN